VKLLFVAPSAYLLGGVQDWLYDLVLCMRKRGYQVMVAIPDGEVHQADLYKSRYPQLDASIFTNATGSEQGRIDTLCQVLLDQSADMVIGVNIVDIYPAVARLRQQGRFKGKVVMTIHAISADFLEDLRTYSAVIDGVIATNQLTCGLVQELGSELVAMKVHYAPYGVDVPLKKAHRSLATSSEILHIAWIGRLEQPQKRVHDLPCILEQLDRSDVEYRLSIVGDGPERSQLEINLEPWLQVGRVRLLGCQDKSTLYTEVLAGHQALLITSSWETGPIVAWEAMAAGMAVVTSRYLGSGREQFLKHDHNSLVFEVGDAREAAHQLARLQDPEVFEELTNQAYADVNQRYSTQASLEAWIQAFEAIEARTPQAGTYLPEFSIPASGRLDRWIGVRRAERLRRLLGLRFRHSAAGSEWPHTAHGNADNGKLLEKAAILEQEDA
jgi:glycosyltransferase involved in cell wall biosynthesis